MAQTRRKRQTKHRGNATGMIESRGRTGRKPTPAEKRGTQAQSAKARGQKLDPRDKPPTWRSAFMRSMVAAVLMLLIVAILLHSPTQAIALFPIVLLMYVPISYYTDKWVYDRRMRRKRAAGGSASR